MGSYGAQRQPSRPRPDVNRLLAPRASMVPSCEVNAQADSPDRDLEKSPGQIHGGRGGVGATVLRASVKSEASVFSVILTLFRSASKTSQEGPSGVRRQRAVGTHLRGCCRQEDGPTS